MEATATVTVTTDTCDLCGAELPEGTVAASDLIYGPEGLGFNERVRRALAKAVQRATTEPMLAADPERDEVAGQAAVLEALGLSSFAALAHAWAHYGTRGECRTDVSESCEIDEHGACSNLDSQCGCRCHQND